MVLSDFTPAVTQAILGLEVNDVRSRRELYDKLRASIAGEFEDIDPALDPQEIELQQRFLEFTIRCVEADLRAGIAIDAPDYQPNGLSKYRENLERRSQIIAARAAPEPEESGWRPDETEVRRLARMLGEIDARSSFSSGYRWPPRPVVWHALLLRRGHDMAAVSRIALVWLVCEPAILIGAVIFGYALFGAKYVMNMEVATFAVLGVVAWGSMRVVTTRIGRLISTQTDVYNLPPVTPYDYGVPVGLLNLVIYTGVAVLALAAVIILDLGQLPDSFLWTGVMWMSLWLNGVAIGYMLSGLYLLWPYARRFTPVVFRALSLCSGLAFVSEQLPVEYRPYFLWNPLMHGLQLLRSAYFADYQSEDASILYYVAWTVVILVLGLMVERVMRPNLVPR